MEILSLLLDHSTTESGKRVTVPSSSRRAALSSELSPENRGVSLGLGRKADRHGKISNRADLINYVTGSIRRNSGKSTSYYALMLDCRKGRAGKEHEPSKYAT